jgi:peptidoglycan hydrolase-like protein with peptidoglycan-binding domain
VTSVRIRSVSCIPTAFCSGNPHQVSTHGTLLLGGTGLKAGMIVAFPAKANARITRSSPRSKLRRANVGLVLTVPAAAHSGHIMILLSHGRHTSSYGPIYLYRHALHPPDPPETGATPSGTAFDGQGMWIWYLSDSEGGSVASIVAQAHAAGVTTLYIKSSDGSENYWSQFSPQLVAELHANGLKACAWQYVYGTNPAGEAELGARAVAAGADCLLIDAESEYEGKYAAAQTYLTDLRAKIGASYPLGLASFPYVSYHPSFPYSVFLGPGGAQFDVPQMYWKDIGVSVDTVYANTYIANRIYGRTIFPLGQTYGGVSEAEILRFREEAVDYGAPGTSFWDWQETKAAGWTALTDPLTPLSTVTPNLTYPELSSGSKGDQVLWMQEHLASAIATQETTGSFGAQTVADLEAFQTAHGIAPSGVTTAPTWEALLALPPVAVVWTGSGPSG